MRSGRGRRHADKKKDINDDDGFGNWGGYMAAKKAKLLDQFRGSVEKVSDIFNGIEILVNGLTHPSANELKDLMAAHGGIYHMYQGSRVTHIIASNLPNTKIKHLGSVPVVKPSWITESIALSKLLDYRRYLLYTNQSSTQPALNFRVVPKVTQNNEKSESKDKVNSSSNVEANNNLAQTSSRITKTASDPRFLEEFYNNSRLHLIATLGTEFKHLVGQLRDKSDGRFPGKEKLLVARANSNERFVSSTVIMHIDMDCFFVSVGLRNHPDLKGKPVAITHARNAVLNVNDPNRKAIRDKEFELYQERLPEGAPSRVVDVVDKIDGLASMSEIASCSYEARKCGIKNGMFLGAAIKLCPDLKTLPYDFEGYKEVSNKLYQTIASYTLDIEAVSCDEMYVDVTQILRETGMSVNEWATHIRNEIITITGCPCSTGFGANRLQARLATRKAKPAGQYYLQADDVETYMSEIPLADIPGVGRATLAKLTNLGLTTCGDVQVASVKVLQTELGTKAGKTLWEQARGIDIKPLDYHHERKSVSAEVNYGIRFKTLNESYTFLESLSNEVFNRLNDIGMRARSLTLKLLVRAADAPVETAKFLGHGVCDALSKSTTSSLILNDPKTIYREAKILYDKLAIPFAELRGIGIQLTKLEKNAPVNKALSNFLKQGAIKNNEQNKPQSIDTDRIKKLPNDVGDVSKLPAQIKDHVSVANNSENGEQATEGNDQGGGLETSSKPVVEVSVSKKVLKKTENSAASSSKTAVASKKGKSKSIKRNNSNVSNNSENNTIQKLLTKKSSHSRPPVVYQQEAIDINVLNELPEEIRSEIIKEYQLESKLKSSSPQLNKNINNDSPATDSNKTNMIVKKSHFDGLSWEQMKPIIKTWIRSETEPSDFDVDMFAEHLKQLAVDRKIEMLKCIFNFLHRVLSELNCNWHKAYFSMVNSMQEGMVARYGNTLLVDRGFHCCKM